MTIESNISAQTLLGDGETRAFPFTFKAFAEQVKVIVTTPDNSEEDVTSLCDIEIEDMGGSVTYPISEESAPLPSGCKLTIMRDMDFLQETDFVTGSRYSSEVIEQRLDRLTAQDQQLKEELSRTLKVGVASGIPSENIIQEVFNASSEAKTAAQNSCLDAKSAASSAELARKWAANPEDEPVGEDAATYPEFSARHYASKLAAMLENAGEACPEAPGFVPSGGEVGQFYGVKRVAVEMTRKTTAEDSAQEPGENPNENPNENPDENTGENEGENNGSEDTSKEVYGFFDLPASVEPMAGMMPLGNENGQILIDWVPSVATILPSTPDELLPNVAAIRSYVERYMGDNPPNVTQWITSSTTFTAPMSGPLSFILVGGGGKGGTCPGSTSQGAGGGGSGEILYKTVNVSRNNTYTITIGAAGGSSSAFGFTAKAGETGGATSGYNGGKGGNGTSGGGGGKSASGGTGGAGGSSIYLYGYAGSAGGYSSGNGGAGGKSTALVPFQLATAGGAGGNLGGGGGSTGIPNASNSLPAAGSGTGGGAGNGGGGGRGYGAGGGGGGANMGGGVTAPGNGVQGVCILFYYNPDLTS